MYLLTLKKNGLFDICENLTFYYSFSLTNWLKQLILLMGKNLLNKFEVESGSSYPFINKGK